MGCIHNAIPIDFKEREEVYDYYNKKGWIDEMKEDVFSVGGREPLNMDKGLWLFNVKYKPEDVVPPQDPPLKLNPSCITSDRYKLKGLTGKIKYITDKRTGGVETLNTSSHFRVNKEGKIEVDPKHKKMQNSIKAILEEEGYEGVMLEQGNVDITGEFKGETHFFELKTLYTAKKCIREALGQLLEYAHYPNSTHAEKLFIIGNKRPAKYDEQYMKCLREKYNIPVWYRWYEFDVGKLHKEV